MILDAIFENGVIRLTPFDIVIVSLPSASSRFSRIESPSLYGIITATFLNLLESKNGFLNLKSYCQGLNSRV